MAEGNVTPPMFARLVLINITSIMRQINALSALLSILHAFLAQTQLSAISVQSTTISMAQTVLFVSLPSRGAQPA